MGNQLTTCEAHTGTYCIRKSKYSRLKTDLYSKLVGERRLPSYFGLSYLNLISGCLRTYFWIVGPGGRAHMAFFRKNFEVHHTTYIHIYGTKRQQQPNTQTITEG